MHDEKLEKAARWVCDELGLGPDDPVRAEDGRKMKRWQLKAEQIGESALLNKAAAHLSRELAGDPLDEIANIMTSLVVTPKTPKEGS